MTVYCFLSRLELVMMVVTVEKRREECVLVKQKSGSETPALHSGQSPASVSAAMSLNGLQWTIFGQKTNPY